MSFPVRFILRHPGGRKAIARQFSSLDSLASAWESHVEKGAAGIAHMPGEDLPLDLAPKQWGEYWGRVLVTESVWAGLPEGRPDLGEEVCRIGGFSLRVAPEPWPLGDPPLQVNWVPRFLAECPEFAEGFSRAGVSDDASYLEKEPSLGCAARARAGVWRFGFILGSGAVADRARNARIERVIFALPPWALGRPLSELRIATAVSRVFELKGLGRVSDFCGITEHEILGMQRMGPKFLSLLKEGLFLDLEKLPHSGPEHLAFGAGALDGRSLFGMILEDIGQLSETRQRVIEDKMGLYRPPGTNQRLAKSLGVSREFIRQVEARVGREARRSMWAHWLLGKLDMILERFGGGVRISDLPGADPFFAGFERLEDSLPHILSMLGSRLCVVDSSSGRHLCALADSEWDAAVEKAGRLVREGIPGAPAPEACRDLAAESLGGSFRGLGELLWEAVEPLCHFLPDDSGTLRLCSYGQSLYSRFDSILETSSEPVHCAEIWRRCCHGCGLPRILGVAASRSILLGKGTYGLERHLSFPVERAGSLARAIEGIVAEAPEKAQWHCAELLEGLQRLGLAGESMTKYEVDYVLSKAGGMRWLGRMVWGRGSSASETRIGIHEAVVSILRDAGKPLSTSEIKERLSRSRGLNGKFFNIPKKPPIRRLAASGQWGLDSWPDP